ncbi:MAG: type II toxin-antitoxin system VapC family toxin [Chloroflexi bacterium]|nr:type II toxin-antitoxin system VapC family toxin [Chloroflexota bacterium]
MKAIEASVALKLVVTEEDSAKAHALWDGWREQRELVVAPPLFVTETVSALGRLVYRGKLDVALGDEAFAPLRRLPVDIMEPPGLYERAWELARELNRPTHLRLYLPGAGRSPGLRAMDRGRKPGERGPPPLSLGAGVGGVPATWQVVSPPKPPSTPSSWPRAEKWGKIESPSLTG